MHIINSIPSPTVSYFDIFSLRIHYYAIFILIGIAAAIWIGSNRLSKRGGDKWIILDVALWAVPSGIVGARLFHVFTHQSDYFGPGKQLTEIFAVWNGGLAIYGGIIAGSLVAYLYCRRSGLRFLSVADALAPGVLVAQAIGRLGNYFNNELFGKPTDLPWGLVIDSNNPAYPKGLPVGTLFHPTFLYEMVWNLIGVAVLLILERRLDLRWGRLFALYLAYYSIGRYWIEDLRVDPSDIFLGLRTNQWSAVVGIVAGVGLYLWSRRRHTGAENSVYSKKATAESSI
jgi:prolipoprotein diacylglyceryl transferase